MLITRTELDCYRNKDIEIEMYMEKLKKWQLILYRAETSYGTAMRAVPEGAEVLSAIRSIINDTVCYLNKISALDKAIEALLSDIHDSKIRAVMYRYYVLGESWEDVIAILGLSKRTAARLHGYGLEIIRKMQE